MKVATLALMVASMAWVADVRAASVDEGASVGMKLIASGATAKLGGYRPQLLKLSADKPAELKKAPEMAAPLYGSLKFGETSYLIALDEPEGKDAVLHVDLNGNGDLTDDEPATWMQKEMPQAGGKKGFIYMGHFSLPLGTGDKVAKVTLNAYRFDKDDPQRGALKTTLLYYSDYAYDGDITLGGTKYHAMLTDGFATGDFRGKAGEAAKAGSGVQLMIDVNADGKFSAHGEIFDAAKPFNIKGTTWKLSDMTVSGAFKIVKSDETVAEIQAPPDHAVGKKITPFTAIRIDGTKVNFPADYKGKLVMLDFWATWCGPCMGEVPGLVKNYNEYHSKGIEILGISLDQADVAEKVKSVTADKGMTWPQVYDGKFWKAAVAEMYGIDSIPAAFLIDGDTGEIVASGNSLRGEALEKTFEKAVAKKGGKGDKP